MESPVLIDTDVLSALMRGDATATASGRKYLAAHGHFTLSIITRYEILRGLRAKGASRQIAAFDVFSAASEILPLTDPIVIRAAEIYADLVAHGRLIGDADILIAATALVHGLALATNNVQHFSRIPGLTLEPWLR